MTCQSCGGRVGVDCFNPQECAYIAHQQEAQKDQSVHESEEHMAHIQSTIAGLEQQVVALSKRLGKLEEALGIVQ